MPNTTSSSRAMAVLVMLATFAVIAVNVLAATGHINGIMPNEISDKYPTVITPAGWAFSIWSLIYTGLIAFSIYQLLPSRIAQFVRLRLPYLASCVFNIAWILLWHRFEVGICAAVIALLLASLMWANFRIGSAGSFVDALLTKGVFGLYAGWVTLATMVNFVVYLVYAGTELSSTTWNLIGIICLTIALVAAVVARVGLRNFVYQLPIAWAAAAIGAKQSGNTAVVLAAALLCVACLIISGSVVTELKSSTT